MITRTMLILIAFTNAMMLATLITLTGFVAHSMVFDIDRVREQHMQDLSYIYQQACKVGTDYPPELRMDQGSFNPNSPTAWCYDRSRENEDKFIDSAMKLGR